MRVGVFSTKDYDRLYLTRANIGARHALTFLDARLGPDTVSLAEGYGTICLFVNDVVDAGVTVALARGGTRLVALRCAGFNNVDLEAAAAAGLVVVRVPAYSPHAVAEHTIALILSLNRKIHRAYARVREGNFAIDGLLGFDLAGRRVGVVGTGRIGAVVVRILAGFGCRILAHDLVVDPGCIQLGADYVSLDRLLQDSDIITLHCPLVAGTRHLLDRAAFARMKPGAMVVNTSRGALLDTGAAIAALKTGRLGSLALDVYEEEADVFFEDHSGRVLQDDVLARLLTFPNVLITSHQGFFTHEALSAIANTTIQSITAFEDHLDLSGVICAPGY